MLVLGALVAGLWGIINLGGPGRTKPVDDRSRVLSARLTSLVSSHAAVPGHVGAMPWPTTGQAAVAVVGAGLMAHMAGPIGPIASLTKMMTALLILEDHPISPGESGPLLRMGPADVAAYVEASQTDESNVPIKNGEVLSEFQLLEALLLPSADNVAERLAACDAGTVAAFVAKMNAKARALGLRDTHYADASGVNPGSRSTAADQAILASDLLTIPVVREIVAEHQVGFPVAGTIYNVNPALGVDGIVGVKSGYTSEAQGCLVTATWVSRGGARALLVAVTLHQPNGLFQAATADEALLARAKTELVAVRPLGSSDFVARVSVPWSTTQALASVQRSPVFVGFPGLRYDVQLTGRALPSASSRVGTATFATSTGVLLRSPLYAAQLPVMPTGWTAPST